MVLASRAEPYGDNLATATYFGADRPPGYPAFLMGWLGSVGSGVSDIPVYRSIQVEGYKTLGEGQEVEFTQVKSQKGWQAAEVEKIAAVV